MLQIANTHNKYTLLTNSLSLISAFTHPITQITQCQIVTKLNVRCHSQINQPVLRYASNSTRVTTRDFQDQIPQAHTHTASPKSRWIYAPKPTQHLRYRLQIL